MINMSSIHLPIFIINKWFLFIFFARFLFWLFWWRRWLLGLLLFDRFFFLDWFDNLSLIFVRHKLLLNMLLLLFCRFLVVIGRGGRGLQWLGIIVMLVLMPFLFRRFFKDAKGNEIHGLPKESSHELALSLQKLIVTKVLLNL